MTRYSLDELAEHAALPPRTIRFYQASGLLPKPRREGRAAVYDDEHRTRLELIGDLRARGLRLDAIRDMVDAGSLGKAPVVALLGPDAASERWLVESSKTFDAPGVAEFLGEANLGLLNELVAAGYLQVVQTDAGRRWYAADLPLLRAALQMAEMGIDVSLSARGRDLVRRRIRSMAEDLVRLWTDEAGQSYAGDATSAELSMHLDRIRAVAWQSAAHVTAQEIERAVARADELARRNHAGQPE
ncbi:MAG: MerR family transcriptional regulator [Jiangellales bacterium]